MHPQIIMGGLSLNTTETLARLFFISGGLDTFVLHLLPCDSFCVNILQRSPGAHDGIRQLRLSYLLKSFVRSISVSPMHAWMTPTSQEEITTLWESPNSDFPMMRSSAFIPSMLAATSVKSVFFFLHNSSRQNHTEHDAQSWRHCWLTSMASTRSSSESSDHVTPALVAFVLPRGNAAASSGEAEASTQKNARSRRMSAAWPCLSSACLPACAGVLAFATPTSSGQQNFNIPLPPAQPFDDTHAQDADQHHERARSDRPVVLFSGCLPKLLDLGLLPRRYHTFTRFVLVSALPKHMFLVVCFSMYSGSGFAGHVW